MAEEAIEIFNSKAWQASLRRLDKKQISDSLSPQIELQVSRWSILARGQMLSAFGDWSQFEAELKQLEATYSAPKKQDDAT